MYKKFDKRPIRIFLENSESFWETKQRDKFKNKFWQVIKKTKIFGMTIGNFYNNYRSMKSSKFEKKLRIRFILRSYKILKRKFRVKGIKGRQTDLATECFKIWSSNSQKFWNSCEFLKEDQWLRNKISVLQARSRAALFVWFESFYNLKVIWTGKKIWESLRQKVGRYPQKSALENIRAVRHYLYKQGLDIKVQFFDFTILNFFLLFKNNPDVPTYGNDVTVIFTLTLDFSLSVSILLSWANLATLSWSKSPSTDEILLFLALDVPITVFLADLANGFFDFSLFLTGSCSWISSIEVKLWLGLSKNRPELGREYFGETSSNIED